MQLVLILLVLVTALGMWEMLRHVLHRRRIPIRIHVNGSRGKSSVARLIAAGLSAGGMAVVGKTTGSAAAVINTDGSETLMVRRSAPNIKEQLSVFRRAARQNCQALVIECMAVRPDLQRVCEHTIVKATHGVITNVRPDHLEVMGPTMDDVAASLAGTVPRRSHLFTAEDRYTGFLAKRSARAHSKFTHSQADAVSAEEMDRFAYQEFPENVSVALDVCRAVGVEREVALAGMWEVTPDVGAMTCHRFRQEVPGVGSREVEFINGFAANDPDSYCRVWRRLGLEAHPERVILLMNIRSDRQRRSQDLAPLFGREMKAAHYVLVGAETALFARLLRRNGISRETIHDFSNLEAPALWERLVTLGPDGARIIGVGNIAGIGNRLLSHLRQKEVTA
ncbi:MAG: poly-gamma-glutamate synthase PgsB [Verrucomicrobia bacterium]|nr:MAG: poly-gamma-glutamate synthase PgsB [Verrucomicrobiota bacterium]